MVALCHRTPPAPAALTAADDRASGDAVAGGEVFDALAHRDHLSRHLMADDDRRLHARFGMWVAERNVERAAPVLVQVCAADSAPGHLHLYLPRWRRRRLRDPLDADVLSPVPDGSFHAPSFWIYSTAGPTNGTANPSFLPPATVPPKVIVPSTGCIHSDVSVPAARDKSTVTP